MPNITTRSVSPRNTLPRPTSRKTPMKKKCATPSGSTTALTPRRRSGDVEDVNATPRASTFDVRGNDGELPSSMTSSIVLESRGSSNPSPDELRDVVGEFAAPKPSSRCFSKTNKAKRIRFYRNGDKFYKGMSYALDTDRLRSMKPLMKDLARAMGHSQHLPHGVRHILTMDGQFRITEIEQFEDGEAYVCSSSDTIKLLDYANAKEPAWCFTLSRPSRTRLALGIDKPSEVVNEPTDFVEPRIITVIRNGVKPRRVVRHLLNKRAAWSFEQVMGDLTAKVKLDCGAIRKLFNLSGNQVTCLRDFFQEDYVFIAYGNEKHSSDDFFVISEEYKRLGGGNRRGARCLPQRRKRMPSRNESLREDRCGSVVPDELARHLPVELSGVFDILRLLGDGNTALVYEVAEKSTGERKALKFVAHENTIGKEALIVSELSIMAQVDHEHIVRLFDSWCIDGSYYMSLELVEGGDLFEHLRNLGRVPERQASSLLRCLVEALHYLHDRSIVHRDIKPENLLLHWAGGDESDVTLKLADFGLSTELPSDGSLLDAICGTPTYVAAEVIMQQGYDEKVDIWATGILLYVMLCGFPPFQSADSACQEDLFHQIALGKFGFPSPAWDSMSWSVKQLILHLVTLDIDQRLTAEELLNSEWIQSCGNVSPEFEAMAKICVQSKVDDDELDLEPSDREYYMSRRASMDELASAAGDSFEFSGSFS